MEKILASMIMLLWLALPAFPGELTFVQASPKDKCAVCGMFVAKYANWTGEIIFQDGTYAVFDGPRDLFTYLTDLKKYAPARQSGDIQAVFVTDYYTLRPINAFPAYYVAGSDVRGPMGPELVPFEKKTDAREFMHDHQGKKILQFKGINADVIKGLE